MAYKPDVILSYPDSSGVILAYLALYKAFGDLLVLNHVDRRGKRD